MWSYYRQECGARPERQAADSSISQKCHPCLACPGFLSSPTVLCYCLLLCNQKCCSVHQNHFLVQCRSVTLPEV